MKYLLFLLSIALPTLVFSQTTLEEYNYVTKGYKVQIESGLDMKKGYIITDIDEVTVGERTASLKALLKITGKDTTVAAYMIKYTRTDNPTEYICIPSPYSTDNTLAQMYFKELYNGEGDSSYRLQLIAYLLSRNLIW